MTSSKVFASEICEVSKHVYFVEHLQMAASELVEH